MDDRVNTGVFILLGTNVGNKLRNLQHAIEKIQDVGIDIVQRSPVVETPAWGFESTNSFYNQVIEVAYNNTPEILLSVLLDIEQQLGRIRVNTSEYTDRKMDLDILLFNDKIIDQPNLIIPHPRMHLRKFTLLPLSLIGGKILHPVLQQSIQQLLNTCPDQSEAVIL